MKFWQLVQRVATCDLMFIVLYINSISDLLLSRTQHFARSSGTSATTLGPLPQLQKIIFRCAGRNPERFADEINDLVSARNSTACHGFF